MGILYHPQVGTILRVDLNDGFRPPEMTKRRPAIVVAPQLAGRGKLCTIVPLSTTAPDPMRPYHLALTMDPPLPAPYDASLMWVKADMILSVAFHRLQLLERGKDQMGQRIYDIRVLDEAIMDLVRGCIKHSLGL